MHQEILRLRVLDVMAESYNDRSLKMEALTNAILKASSSRPSSPRVSPPWFDHECFSASRQIQHLLKLRRLGRIPSDMFSQFRKDYRKLIDVKKAIFADRCEQELVKRAQKEPHSALINPRATQASCPIPSESLLKHFSDLFSAATTSPVEVFPHHIAVSQIEQGALSLLESPISRAEVCEAMQKLKANKAAGPDLVRNEHLKNSPILAPIWAQLFTEYLNEGVLPDCWNESVLKVIPKGKGDPLDVSSWRGIVKRSCIYKLFSSIITRRLSIFLETSESIPQEQHGFRAGKSTMTACESLIRDILTSLNDKRLPLYACFVDFRRAFDMSSRSKALEKLAALGVPIKFLRLIKEMLKDNTIVLDDGVKQHPPFVQTTGFPQGDNLSPILFTTLVMDLPDFIQRSFPTVRVVQYADDLVLTSRLSPDLQKAMALLETFCHENQLEINVGKTKMMKFRRGGPLGRVRRILIDKEVVEYVPSFTYLGVVFTQTGTSFGAHVKERRVKSFSAMSCIRTPHLLSVRTALQLFTLKVAPVALYGVEVTWPHLTKDQLVDLDKVKPTFLKRVLGLPKNALNRLVLTLCGTVSLIEEAVARFGLPETPALREYREELSLKIRAIPPQFYSSLGMRVDTWKAALQPDRHVFTRYSVHGFHSKMCTTPEYHLPEDNCICRFCSLTCELYHHDVCTASPSLYQVAHMA